MNMKFTQIKAVNRKGNLHIKLFGDFNPQAADRLSSTIIDQYSGRGNVFVNTEKIGAVLAQGAQLFKQNMTDCLVPYSNLFMIGQKGAELAPEGSRIIIPKPKKGCCSGCGNCNCGKKKK